MRPCVLVHGGWCGGWHWDDVATRLRAAGLDVHAPTLPGMAERAHEAGPHTTLATHVDCVAQLIEQLDLHDVVLVGHSYGGAVVTGAAWRVASRIAELVYLDAFVPAHGESLASLLGDGFVQRARDAALAAGTPHLVPPMFDVEAATGFTGARAQALAARQCSHPLATLFDAVHAPGPCTVPRTFVYCAAQPLGLFDAFAAHARAAEDWRYVELPCAHDAVHAMPAAIAGLVEHLATIAPGDAHAAVLDADARFFAALLDGDADTLQALLTDDFAIVDIAAGGVTMRTDFIAAIAAGAVRFACIDTDAATALVRDYGDVAIVVGSTRMTMALPDIGEVTVPSRYTHVFRRVHATAPWRLAAAQGTRITD